MQSASLRIASLFVQRTLYPGSFVLQVNKKHLPRNWLSISGVEPVTKLALS